jgi:hypothetical protein
MIGDGFTPFAKKSAMDGKPGARQSKAQRTQWIR